MEVVTSQMQEESTEDDDDWPLYVLEYLPTEAILEIFQHLEWQDLCSISQTCVRFRELICLRSTLWLRLKKLNFRHCAIPSAAKILEVVARCPNTEHLYLDNVLIEEEIETDTNIFGVDRFILNVLRLCPHLHSIYLSMQEITNRSVEALCAKCCELRKISIEENNHISNDAVVDILSTIPTLRELFLHRCSGIMFLEICHQDPSHRLNNITKLSLTSLTIATDQVRLLLRNCPCLTYLDLTDAQHLSHFPSDLQPTEQSGLNTLQTVVLAQCKYLQELQLQHGPSLLMVDVRWCDLLISVQLTCPRLETIQVEGCDQLEHLTLIPCHMTKVKLDNLKTLTNLNINSSILQSVSLNCCHMIAANMLIGQVTDKSHVNELCLIGCKNISPDELNDEVLPKFPELTNLHYGGHSWQQLSISNAHLQQLHIGDCSMVTGFPLDIPCLKYLRLHNCGDVVEQEFLDGLIYGSKSPKNVDSWKPVRDTDVRREPFEDNTGTPQIQHLRLQNMTGIHGKILSGSLHHFKFLTELNIIHCLFLVNLHIDHCDNLRSVMLESCNRLSSFVVPGSCPYLASVQLKWCGMLQKFDVTCHTLCSMETPGTNFAAFSLDSCSLQELSVNGVHTQADHSLSIKCPNLKSLSIQKCDMLDSAHINQILAGITQLKTLQISSSSLLRDICVPTGVEVCYLMGHRRLQIVSFSPPFKIRHLTLNNLPKVQPSLRSQLLQSCEESLRILELRAIPGETNLTLNLKNLESLTLDQGIHLSHLEILCPMLTFLRIQGCPKLAHLSLQLERLMRLNITRSSQLLALRSMDLQTTNVAFLAKVLAYYCPKLEMLRLFRTATTKEQVTKLGHFIPSLRQLVIYQVDLHIPSEETLDPETLGRHNCLPLLVQCQSLS